MGVVVDYLAYTARGAGEAYQVGYGEVVGDSGDDLWRRRVLAGDAIYATGEGSGLGYTGG